MMIALYKDSGGESETNTNDTIITWSRRRRHQRPLPNRESSVASFLSLCFVCSLILLSVLDVSESAVASSSPPTPASSVREEGQPHTIKPTYHPFKKERTIVSGFGSRSTKKTVFSYRPLKRKRKAVDSTEASEEDDDDSSETYFLPKMNSPKMWVQRSKYSNTEGGEDDDALWILIRDENDESNQSNGKKRRANKDDTSNRVILKLTFDDELDDWVAKKSTAKEESEFVRDHPLEKWVPVDGLYGTYRVPSGVLWVLITGTEPIYEAPPIASSSPSSPWWQIRRVTNLEIVHIGKKGYTQPEFTGPSPGDALLSKSGALTASRLREEVRQLHLLRKALKQHDFYYVPKCQNKDGAVIRDMTKTLQRSILETNSIGSSGTDDGLLTANQNTWWKSSDDDKENPCPLPDPRFFWNQRAVDSILKRYQSNDDDEEEDQELQKQIAGLLLEHVVPLTSAFVGVKTNITVDTNDSESSSASSSIASYDQILISRRSRFRAGTRFTMRGADAAGNVANFAETEQICLITTNTSGKKKNANDTRCLRSVASHVQTRGSIPLRWSSPADVKTYRPRVNIGVDPLAQARAIRLHILDQLRLYTLSDPSAGYKTIVRSPDVADIIFVNLVDKHSDQGRLGRAFDAVLRAVVDIHVSANGAKKKREESSQSFANAEEENTTSEPSVEIGADSVKHVWYDFHAEVKNGRWDRLGLLLDEVKPSLTSHNYFLAQPSSKIYADSTNSNSTKWSIQRLQNAVVRTNCMDCLDRTNVVQSIFGRFMLFQQLSDEANDLKRDSKVWIKLKSIFKKKSMALPWEAGEVAHRLLWADNADAISRLYAGTPALKGDFTRTGKRTKKGALDDGMNSLQRYYLNNFLDADRQEGYDILVGHTAFSNMLEENSVDEDVNGKDPLNPFQSIFGATREDLFSDLVKGQSYQSREDLQEKLQEIGISKERDLDLRWLPGDLQTQLRNQVSEVAPNIDDSGKEDPEKVGSIQNFKWDFSSQQAMKAIDERSHAELPWWSKSEGDWLVVDDNDEKQKPSESETNESSQHRSQVILSPTQLATVFYLGLKSPSLLGSLAILILGFVYLPECIDHDYKQQNALKAYLEGLSKPKE